MTIEQEVLQRLKEPPPDKQLEVLDFANALRRSQSNTPKKPLRGLEGIWAGLNVKITEEDITEARREMWANFPRKIQV